MISGEKLGASARVPGWCLLGGLFLLVCGAKWWLINGFGNATPYWDEWDGEWKIITASLAGTLSAAQFFASHNEHRIAFTRLLCLALFRANGQWDPIMTMVAQAPLHALAIVLFVSRAGLAMRAGARVALAAFAGLAGILPFGWENTLWGFQSQFYFQMLFGIAVVWLCWRHEALGGKWWLGAALAFASLFTMAGGVFPIFAVTAFLTLRLIMERGERWKRALAGIVILAAIAAFGVAITPLDPHDPLAAPNFKAFLAAFAGVLSWPSNLSWGFLVVQAPLVLLALVAVFGRESFGNGCWYPVIMGAAFWIQAAATADKRYECWDASRYCDSWIMLLIIAFACLIFLDARLGSRWRFATYSLGAIWLAVCLFGLLDGTVNALPAQLMDKYSGMMEMEQNVREYLATGDAAHLVGKIPYPNREKLKTILDESRIKGVLPSILVNPNPALEAKNTVVSGDGFSASGLPRDVEAPGCAAFGSYGADGVKSKGGITLEFKAPAGMREIELRTAGYPGARGMTFKVKDGRRNYSIAPPVDPGIEWRTIEAPLSGDSPVFKIEAEDKSARAWFAFTAPRISNVHWLGRWARRLAALATYVVAAGLTLLAVGAAAITRSDP